tara:strand:- start:3131 stop:3388 length:258 start_codon:yes stop_codon:yes gene_type:complete
MLDKDAILKLLEVPLREARKMSIYGKEGRIFLIATADSYGYDVDQQGNILLKNGSKMPLRHPDYNSIIESAMKQASNESPVGRDW